MSIYATTLALGGPLDDHDAPIAYAGSHVLPTDDDERGGALDLAAIPGHVQLRGRPALSDGEDWPYHPWLRVSVNEQTVVLDRDQAVALAAELHRWLGHTEEVIA